MDDYLWLLLLIIGGFIVWYYFDRKIGHNAVTNGGGSGNGSGNKISKRIVRRVKKYDRDCGHGRARDCDDDDNSSDTDNDKRKYRSKSRSDGRGKSKNHNHSNNNKHKRHHNARTNDTDTDTTNTTIGEILDKKDNKKPKESRKADNNAKPEKKVAFAKDNGNDRDDDTNGSDAISLGSNLSFGDVSVASASTDGASNISSLPMDTDVASTSTISNL